MVKGERRKVGSYEDTKLRKMVKGKSRMRIAKYKWRDNDL